MWFKNIQLFLLSSPFDYSQADMQLCLERQKKHECPAHQASNMGWISPFDKQSTLLTLEQDRYVLLTFSREEKLLPASVINEQSLRKIEQTEAMEARRINKKEKQRIKEDIFSTLLPQAFSKTKTTNMIINKKSGWIIVDTSSRAHAECCIEQLRSAIGSLPIQPISTAMCPSRTLSNWLLQGSLPSNVEISNRCELFDAKMKDTSIKFNGVDLLSQSVFNHLENGRMVRQIAINWHDQLSLLLSNDFSIQRIQYLDMKQLTKAETKDDMTDTERLDTEFSLITPLYTKLIEEMIGWFGGLSSQDTESKEQHVAANT